LMHKVGWLEVQEVDGRPVLIFPKWERHMSQSAKRRALTAKRVCNARSVTEALPEKRREEKSNKENSKKKSTFTPPTPTQVEQYAATIGYKINGEAFVASYEQKGWLVGKARMKSWEAAVRNWKANGWGQDNGKPQPPRTASPEHRRKIMRHRKAHAIWVEHTGDPEAGEAAIVAAGLSMDDLDSPSQD
jgi:hypothetical protein